VDRSRESLLNTGLAELFRLLGEEADRRGIEIHWASAWQMYQAVDAPIHARSPVPNKHFVTAKPGQTLSERDALAG
jgi:hypothetical protein